jgi:L-alanine-DL-glutamate epimerase-like enolase superfamily enzyme
MGVIGLKVYRPGGGITNAKKILNLAHLLGIPCLFHDDIELGVSLAAATHLIAANLRDIQFKSELSGYPDWLRDDVVKAPLKVGRGFAEVPEGPGLGVELDDAKIKKYSTSTITCE